MQIDIVPIVAIAMPSIVSNPIIPIRLHIKPNAIIFSFCLFIILIAIS